MATAKLTNEFLKNASLSSGTMRTADLIPAFMHFLESNARDKHALMIIEYNATELSGENLTNEQQEQADYMLEELFNTINSIAPKGYYFGAHPGDGTDYGFWEAEEF